jgi:hypothetical protein
MSDQFGFEMCARDGLARAGTIRTSYEVFAVPQGTAEPRLGITGLYYDARSEKHKNSKIRFSKYSLICLTRSLGKVKCDKQIDLE